MKLNEMFPSKYLKSSDFDEEEVKTLTIKDVEMEEMSGKKGNGDDSKQAKPVIYFREKDVKPFVCNKTNAQIINKIYNVDDTDEWIGKRIGLFVTQVDAFGEQQEAIRVKSKVPPSAKPDPGVTGRGIVIPTKSQPEPEPQGEEVPF